MTANDFETCLEQSAYDFKEIIRVCTHLALENLPIIKVKTIELVDSFTNVEGPLVSQIVVDVLGDLPLIQVLEIFVLVTNAAALE